MSITFWSLLGWGRGGRRGVVGGGADIYTAYWQFLTIHILCEKSNPMIELILYRL